MSVKDLEPKECFTWFAELCRIPRGSRREQRASDFLVAFARERGLEASQDAIGNVFIRKPAAKGMEKAPTVILQGHMDMVCVKEDGLEFNFDKDSIKVMTEGDKVFADRTTLGADNGIAVAFILALLDSKDIPHPPLEAIITVQEEVGMGGASAFDASRVTGSYFINIDSEEEGIFCASCAGGRRILLKIPTLSQSVTTIMDRDRFAFWTITLEGLQGGHSGLDIIKERGNSNKLLARVLDGLAGKFEYYLASLGGGTATNVIPKESSATVFIKADAAELRRELDHWAALFRHELMGADGAGLTITCTEAAWSDTVLTPETLSKVVSAALLMPDGIVSMDLNITGQRLVESSSNFAVVSMEDGEIVFQSQTRSSVASKKEFIYRQIETIGRLVGAQVEFFGDYPAWEFNPNSTLREVFLKAYKELYGKEAAVEGIHAGLECGLFSEKFRELGRPMDFIAFGPTITGAHSTKETLSRSSAENAWKLLKDVMRRMGELR